MTASARSGAGLGLALVLLAGVGWFGVRASLRSGAGLPTLEERYLADGRIVPLIYDCHFGKTFDAPTVDMIEVLVSKLDRGQRDPLQVAKKELAASGAAAVPDLRRLFDEVYQDRWRSGVLLSVLGTTTLMDGPWGIEMLRLGLQHPAQAVRLTALKGISRHGEATDYDMVLRFLPLAGSIQAQADYAGCMHALDPQRFCAEAAGWMRSGEYPDLWQYVLLDLTEASDPALVAQLKELAELRDEMLIPFLLAPAARDGDAEALDELHRRLASERPAQQQIAAQALARIGRVLDVAPLLRDPHPGVRAVAAEALIEALLEAPAGTPQGEEIEAWLAEGLSDTDSKVREMCLLALVERGDESAAAHALELLEGNVVERELGIRALRGRWEANAGSAESAFQRLIRLHEASRGRGSELRISVFQAVGHVPLRDAAEFLLEMGRRARGRVRGLEPFRWFCAQVYNTGPVGRALLRESLATESDPFRRLSLIEYIWQDHSDAARECLLGVLNGEQLDPFERLYAADRLLRVGPAERVAPELKRFYLGCTHPVVRPAMQCLLWTWYGQHYE